MSRQRTLDTEREFHYSNGEELSLGLRYVENRIARAGPNNNELTLLVTRIALPVNRVLGYTDKVARLRLDDV
jgi:hypothetical protein